MHLSPCKASGVKNSQPDKKTTGIANVLTLPAKRAGQAGRVMSTCRPLARLFLSPSSARTLTKTRARPLSSKGAGAQQVAQPDGSALKFSVAISAT